MVALLLLAGWAITSVIAVQEIVAKIIEVGQRERQSRRRRDLGLNLAYHSSSLLVQVLLQDYCSFGGLLVWSMCS